MSDSFVVNSSVTTAELESSLVVLDLSSNTYFRLNGLGAAIWRKIEKGEAEASIIDELSAEYDTDHSKVAGDVSDFVHELKTAGLIESDRAKAGN